MIRYGSWPASLLYWIVCLLESTQDGDVHFYGYVSAYLRRQSLIFSVVAFLDIGAMFAFAYIEQLYDSTSLLVLQFLVILTKLFALYNAFTLWSQLSKEDQFKLPDAITTSVSLDK